MKNSNSLFLLYVDFVERCSLSRGTRLTFDEEPTSFASKMNLYAQQFLGVKFPVLAFTNFFQICREKTLCVRATVAAKTFLSSTEVPHLFRVVGPAEASYS